LQKLRFATQTQQPEKEEERPLTVNNAADPELVDDVVGVPQLSVLAELDDETGEGLLDEGLLDDGSSDKTEEL